MPDLKEGSVFRVPYPFYLGTYTGYEEDGPFEAKSWIPGTKFEMVSPDTSETTADAIGEMILTVVSCHKPGRFPMRVFYTRRFIDPDGREFGKNACRIATAGKFNKLILGYRHRFNIGDQEYEPLFGWVYAEEDHYSACEIEGAL